MDRAHDFSRFAGLAAGAISIAGRTLLTCSDCGALVAVSQESVRAHNEWHERVADGAAWPHEPTEGGS